MSADKLIECYRKQRDDQQRLLDDLMAGRFIISKNEEAGLECATQQQNIERVIVSIAELDLLIVQHDAECSIRES